MSDPNLLELTGRIEERLKSLYVNQDDMKKEVFLIGDQIRGLITRVSALEKVDLATIQSIQASLITNRERINNLESANTPIAQKALKDINELQYRVGFLEKFVEEKKTNWNNILNAIVQILILIISSIILFKLGVK